MAVSKKHLKRRIKWGVLALIVIYIAALLIFLGVRSRNLDRKMDAERDGMKQIIGVNKEITGQERECCSTVKRRN